MGRVKPLQMDFNRMVRDQARDRLPADAVWNSVDYIPQEIGAPTAKRGGWTYESQALTSVLAAGDFCSGVLYAPFASGGQLLAHVWDYGGPTGRLAQVVSTSSTTDRGSTGAATTPLQNPVFYRDNVYFPAATPLVYGGSSNVANLGGSPPGGRVATIYKDMLILASSVAQPNRLWFSGAGNPASWDTVNSWLDTSAPVNGMHSLRNGVLVFHNGSFERLLGSIPPPDRDMSLGNAGDVGVESGSAFSIGGTDEFCCFANQSGAYMTDGASVIDLTLQGGMKSYWAEVIRGAGAAVRFAGAFFRGYYIVTLLTNVTNPAFVDCLAVHIDTRRWMRFSNITAFAFARRVAGQAEELYFADSGETRISSLSSMFFPTAAKKRDGDNTIVAPTLETRYYRISEGQGRVKNVYFQYDLREDTGAPTDNPTIGLSYITSPEATSYNAINGYSGSAYPLADTLEMERVRRFLGKETFGVAFKLTQANPSATTRLYEIALDARARESSRV